MLAIILLGLLHTISAQQRLLVPPYFNLAEDRDITATATCGVGDEITEPELYCKLTGANPEEGDLVPNLIQGQFCDSCDPRDPSKSHPASQAIDGTQRWWQSPPLSRGPEYNEVNLTISLGQEFHVAYVFIKMGNAPRPGVWVLERSKDNGETYKPWQYFADTPSDCSNFFNTRANEPIRADDHVLCTTEYSKVVPLEGGEIVVSLVNGRPSANNFSYAETLREWTKATNVRLRLLRTKTLLGHLMAVARQDPTVTRRYYYSIKDISIGGRCVCNGHADVCDKTDPEDPKALLCRCQHNTCGPQCETCCPGFVQKPWRPATVDDVNACEPCQCYGHSNECIYDPEVAEKKLSIDIHGNYEGGGVCQNCRHNTEGINCEKCKFGFFRPRDQPLNSSSVCEACICDPRVSTGDCDNESGRCFCLEKYAGDDCDRCNLGYYDYPTCRPCDCNINGTRNAICEVGGGQCPCKPNYAGRNCDRCAYGYYGFPECKPCGCDRRGSINDVCEEESGQCSCKNNYGGRNCSECANGYYNFPYCQFCSCEPAGTVDQICDKDTGRCICKDNFYGERCDRCAAGFYNYPNCIECGCVAPGSDREACYQNGQCSCKEGYTGRVCDECAPGYYSYPDCKPCNCETPGSVSRSCDQQTGQCQCRPTFEGQTCNKCKENYYNYPICEECNCNPAGAKEVEGYPLGGCGATESGRLCECKERVTGRLCDMCKPTFYNLNIDNVYGCEDCDCFQPGTVSGNRVCDTRSGQCMCKTYTDGRRCSTCAAGTYKLREFNLLGCEDCGCNIGGSVGPSCDQETGQCQCKPRVTGRTCDRPIINHFVPTMFQFKYEMEDGHTPEGGPVRFEFDERVFPGFSWRGYATFSRLQEEVQVDFNVYKPSLYHVVFRFVNLNNEAVNADITMTPESENEIVQTSVVQFKPSREPQFVTVSGNTLATFVLNPGKWTLGLKTPERIYVDYMVLLPQAYYEASVLQDPVRRPCLVENPEEPCVHFIYVDSPKFTIIGGENGFVEVNGTIKRTQLYENRDILNKLGSNHMGLLDENQQEMNIHIVVDKPGKYVFIAKYHSTVEGRTQRLDVNVRTREDSVDSQLILPSCPYSTLCRQIIVDREGHPAVYDIKGTYATLSMKGNRDINVGIDSIIAVPVDEWDYDYVRPHFKCVSQDGKCVQTSYRNPAGSIKVEFEAGQNADKKEELEIPDIEADIKVVKLGGDAPSVNISAMIRQRGPYTFVIHYYNKDSTGFKADVHVEVDGRTEKGTVDLGFCPSVSGCRAVVKFENEVEGGGLDLQDAEIFITFNTTSAPTVSLDYALIIPTFQYTPTILDIGGVDRSGDFITVCGKDNFDISGASPQFCQDAAFKITTEYNNGALDCDCNVDGSLSLRCDEFGGQCRCRENVIGRDCSQCRTGYYGFPRCRQCQCPSGLCHPVTGGCVCPPRVTGPRCDVCLPRTFGFDPLIGCEECNCDPYGVQNGDTECDSNTGQCKCRENVGGRRCDRCLPGHHTFPNCYKCDCDPSGTEPGICDQSTGQCTCKANTEGPRCDRCKPGTYYMENANPNGCTACFCFGTTTRCESSDWRWNKMTDMRGWAVTNIANPRTTLYGDTWVLQLQDGERIEQDAPVYWIAPEPYLGNKVTSYGGTLNYTVYFDLPSEGESYGTVQPDVRIEGNNLTIVHIAPEQPAPSAQTTISVVLRETNFRHESSNDEVTREQFMMALARIQALHIRANYYDRISSSRLREVNLEVASTNGTGEVALNVEQCQCPPNYRGPSCELCAAGYYRARTGPYLGVCVPCQCNGKADTCDPVTGECTDCRNNYGGPQCLSCKKGYYEDEETGVCNICSCPLPTPGNNFADTCEVGEDGTTLRCYCYPGYYGARCDRCEPGYYGDPRARNGSCNRCECSGNINMRDWGSCDQNTGECLKCINNSTGDNCERCKDWWYGDAIDRKDCQPCTCNRLGTARCDYRNGYCLCKPNVVGELCDRCGPSSFGFESGEGCADCDCAIASTGNTCDVQTGQCECLPGVTGRRCDQCQDGYWNYGPNGCQKCQCEYAGAVTCDPQTGRCMCMPGVTGPQCDRCLPRYIALPGRVGCRECDSCVHLLLDELDYMDSNITDVRRQLQDLSVGVFAIRRLQRINDTAHDLRPRVDNLVPGDQDNSAVTAVRDELVDVQNSVADLEIRSESVYRRANGTGEDISGLRKQVEVLEELVRNTVEEVNGAVEYTKEVHENIKNSIENVNIEDLLDAAERILTELEGRDFSERGAASKAELESAIELLKRIKDLKFEVDTLHNSTTEIQVKIREIDDRLRDLYNSSQYTIRDADSTKNSNANLKRYLEDTSNKIKRIQDLDGNMKMMLEMSRDLLVKAKDLITETEETYKEVRVKLSELDGAISRLREEVNELAQENDELRELVDQAMEHALSLKQYAERLDRMFAGTRDAAADALRAVEAYKSIVTAINESLNASKEAVATAEKAQSLTNGLAERASAVKEASIDLLRNSETTKRRVTDELHPRLERAEIEISNIEAMNKRSNDSLSNILEELNKLPPDGYSEQANRANETATDAKEQAEAAEKRVQEITDNLPNIRQRIVDIKNEVRGAGDDVRNSLGAVERVKELVPLANDLLTRLPSMADRVDKAEEVVKANITALKEKIAIARGEANRLRIGMTFTRDTELEIRSPSNLEDSGSFTKLSFYVKTQEPNGLLAYIGPEQAVGMKNDYLAVEILNGNVNLVYDLGGGSKTIVNSQRSVNDGRWHGIFVERSGKKGTLTIKTDQEQDVTEEGTASGFYAVFNPDPARTKFYIGGVPDNVVLPVDVKNRDFEGCMQDFDFDSIPLGFWNFVEAEENREGCVGRPVATPPDTDEFRFEGDGFVILQDDGKLMPNSKTNRVDLDFRTYASDGLIMATGQDMDYFGIWLRNGYVVISFDLGSGQAETISKKPYNDGKWHTMRIMRRDKTGYLKIDEDPPVITRSAGRLTDLDTDKFIYIAGITSSAKLVDSIPRTRFFGCLRAVRFQGRATNLMDNKGAMGILPGCSQVSRLVSFDRTEENSYISSPSVNVERNFDMTMRFRVLDNEGLIFYVANDDQTQYVSLALSNGKVEYAATGGNERISLTSDKQYNDGRWHYITLDKNGQRHTLLIDEKEMKLSSPENARRRIATTSPLYFGGYPPTYIIASGNVVSTERFYGCLADITVNNVLVNFADASPQMQQGTKLELCPVEARPTEPPTEPPTEAAGESPAKPTQAA